MRRSPQLEYAPPTCSEDDKRRWEVEKLMGEVMAQRRWNRPQNLATITMALATITMAAVAVVGCYCQNQKAILDAKLAEIEKNSWALERAQLKTQAAEARGRWAVEMKASAEQQKRKEGEIRALTLKVERLGQRAAVLSGQLQAMRLSLPPSVDMPRSANFAVIASESRSEEAVRKAEGLQSRGVPYPVAVFLNPVRHQYAVTLGGPLDRREANARVGFARVNRLAPDAYVGSGRWLRVSEAATGGSTEGGP